MSADLSNVLNKMDEFNDLGSDTHLPDAPPPEGDVVLPSEPLTEEQPADSKPLLEQLELDEPICVDGPTRAQVEQIKAQLSPGTQLIFYPLVDGRGILWKTLNRGEWKALKGQLTKIEDETKREDFLFAKICLFPDVRDHNVINTLPAGAVSNVMAEFYVYAGFTPVMESIVL